jgi:hypothetical protein
MEKYCVNCGSSANHASAIEAYPAEEQLEFAECPSCQTCLCSACVTLGNEPDETAQSLKLNASGYLGAGASKTVVDHSEAEDCQEPHSTISLFCPSCQQTKTFITTKLTGKCARCLHYHTSSNSIPCRKHPGFHELPVDHSDKSSNLLYCEYSSKSTYDVFL